MQKLVFDTSAIFNFGKRGELEFLLERLATERTLLITPEVESELLDPYYKQFLKKYFKIQKPKDVKIEMEQLKYLVTFLGLGEVSVILLASELDAIAVLDERTARLEAEKLKIKIIGTLGILARA